MGGICLDSRFLRHLARLGLKSGCGVRSGARQTVPFKGPAAERESCAEFLGRGGRLGSARLSGPVRALKPPRVLGGGEGAARESPAAGWSRQRLKGNAGAAESSSSPPPRESRRGGEARRGADLFEDGPRQAGRPAGRSVRWLRA